MGEAAFANLQIPVTEVSYFNFDDVGFSLLPQVCDEIQEGAQGTVETMSQIEASTSYNRTSIHSDIQWAFLRMRLRN
jgi:hypothetical protein